MKSAFLSFMAAGLFLVSSCGADNKPVTVGAEGPANTMKTTSADTTATPAVAGAYVCPMDPEVTSDKPGDCPKCGMALVKQ
ncbi:hypothetical protein MUN82_20015 [Hymenobacter aerilatus]|uniref:Heavy metal binding domain-containing protein n=1 Tax=Hymenobacter aerilatus TaxID=2932251 RepID=A0A8T9STY3_9BACT|nr:heavy metal-binding domain-containing protein [Hymenobacter aerilatus]UOR05207.1 hypothetical protein MUN82_20015 [Hymenobacter aerilatus]